MATKEIINFNSHYEDIDDTAWPANPNSNQVNQEQDIDAEVSKKIADFRRRKLGHAARSAAFDLHHLLA